MCYSFKKLFGHIWTLEHIIPSNSGLKQDNCKPDTKAKDVSKLFQGPHIHIKYHLSIKSL